MSTLLLIGLLVFGLMLGYATHLAIVLEGRRAVLAERKAILTELERIGATTDEDDSACMGVDRAIYYLRRGRRWGK